MAIRNLNHLSSLFSLRGEITFTLDQLKTHPLTEAHVPAFEGLRDDWTATFGEDLALRDAQSAAQARIVSADATLNALASRVSKAVLTATGDDRTHALYVALFKKKSLTEFRRPVLRAQLEGMRAWIQPLGTSNVPALAALGPEVAAAVAAADQAVAARTALENEATFFREAGNRRNLFNKVNAVRKTTYGELASMAHETMGLPSDFADQFFRHQSGKSETEPTLESVDEEIAELEEVLAEKQELRAALQAEADQAAQQQTELAAKQAEVAALQKAADDAERQAAEARAKIAELTA